MIRRSCRFLSQSASNNKPPLTLLPAGTYRHAAEASFAVPSFFLHTHLGDAMPELLRVKQLYLDNPAHHQSEIVDNLVRSIDVFNGLPPSSPVVIERLRMAAALAKINQTRAVAGGQTLRRDLEVFSAAEAAIRGWADTAFVIPPTSDASSKTGNSKSDDDVLASGGHNDLLDLVVPKLDRHVFDSACLLASEYVAVLCRLNSRYGLVFTELAPSANSSTEGKTYGFRIPMPLTADAMAVAVQEELQAAKEKQQKAAKAPVTTRDLAAAAAAKAYGTDELASPYGTPGLAHVHPACSTWSTCADFIVSTPVATLPPGTLCRLLSHLIDMGCRMREAVIVAVTEMASSPAEEGSTRSDDESQSNRGKMSAYLELLTPQLCRLNNLRALAEVHETGDLVQAVEMLANSQALLSSIDRSDQGLLTVLRANVVQRAVGGIWGVDAFDEEITHHFDRALATFHTKFDFELPEQCLQMPRQPDTDGFRDAYASVLDAYSNFYLSFSRVNQVLPPWVFHQYAPALSMPMLPLSDPFTTRYSTSKVTCTARRTLGTAQTMSERALKINRVIFPDRRDNLKSAMHLATMALVYAEARDYLHCSGLFNSAMRVVESNYGRGSEEVLDLLKVMEAFQRSIGSPKEAEATRHKVEAMRRDLGLLK